MTPNALVSYLYRMLGSSGGARAQGAGLEIPSRIESAHSLVLHQWALWPLKTPPPIPHFLFPSIFRFPVAWQRSNHGLCRRLATVSLEQRTEVGGCALMKSEQASILGKVRRQIAQPLDSPSQKPPHPAAP